MSTRAGAEAIPCPSVLCEMTTALLRRDQRPAFPGQGRDLAWRGSSGSHEVRHTIGIKSIERSRPPTRIDVVASKGQRGAGSHACQRNGKPAERFLD